MAALGELVVKLSANIAEFTGAMDKAAYTSQKRMDEMIKHAERAGQIIGGALVAGAGALTIAIGRVVERADEMGRLAEIAGSSVERFSEMTYAVQRHGLEAEKLADIYKDVQDKLGDFLQNGSGPMKDFFENIAPKVGVTADQFKRLSGPDALQLYYNSLEKANLSQSELTFYMEAVANDATKLIPLLRDGGQGFSDAAAEAQAFGQVLSNEVVESSRAVHDNLRRMSAVQEGLVVQVTAKMLPTIELMSSEMVQLSKDTDLVSGVAKAATILFQTLAVVGSDVAFVFKMTGQEIGGIAAQLAALARGDFAGFRGIGEMMRADAAAARADLDAFQARIMSIGTASSKVAQDTAAVDSGNGPFGPAIRSAKAAKAAVDEAAKAMQVLQREGQRVFEATRTPAEQLAAEYERLNNLLEKGAIDWDTYGRAVMDAQEKLMPMAKATKVAETNIKEVEKAASSVDIVITNSFQSAADAIANFAMGGKMNFGDMVNSMVRDLLRLEMQMQMTSAYKSVGGLSGLGSLIGGWFGAASGSTYNTKAFSQQSMMLAAQDAGLAGRANGGYMSAGTTYLVGERGPELLTLGSSSGSMTPNHALGGASLESVRVEIRNEGTPQEVTRAQPRFDAEGLIVEVFTRDIANEGPMAKSMQSRFGLSRAAGAYA